MLMTLAEVVISAPPMLTSKETKSCQAAGYEPAPVIEFRVSDEPEPVSRI
ncbi:hypothetical protein DFO47_102454 [Arthrobacter sp. AG258]|nr:hypothetical protein DFO47_102454 [Arthrobacter sp. AG258]